MTMDVELVPMFVSPFLLLGGGHANPKKIRIGCVDSIYDSCAVLIGELRFVRWGVGHYIKVCILYSDTLAYK